jgi:outer membrane biosynthesis protein TonB
VVYLKILVGKDGQTEQVEAFQVEAEKGGEAFKQAAIEAGKESVWLPATRGGKPVAVWVVYPIRFTLKGGPPPKGARILEERGQQPSKRGK